MDEFISVQVDNMIIQQQIQMLRLQQNNQNDIYIYIYIYSLTHHNANTLNAGDKMMLGHEDSFSL